MRLKTSSKIVASLLVIGLSGCVPALKSHHPVFKSPDPALVQLIPTEVGDCGLKFKWNCIHLVVYNNGRALLRIPVQSNSTRVLAYDFYFGFEERAGARAWKPTAVTIGSIVAPTEDAVVQYRERENIWVVLPGWDARDAGKQFRIFLIDENGTKYYSVPFDWHGRRVD